jgi:dipeptidase E
MTNHQRLFLGSAELGALPDWLACSPRPARRAVLIPTASNPIPSAPWVDAAAELLSGAGSGFARLAVPAVRSGRLDYVGISAGAALAAPDLAYFQEADAAIDPGDPGVAESTTGLSLAPFLVLAHRNRGRAARHDRQIAEHGAENFVSIDDHQAVTVDGDSWRVIDSDSAPGLLRPGWSR